MKPKGSKLEPKLKLDMPWGEALGRFLQTKPKEVEASIKRAKQKKPPGGKKPSGGSSQSDVVSLRKRRMRKRNEGR
jgi:hypothetical protein